MANATPVLANPSRHADLPTARLLFHGLTTPVLSVTSQSASEYSRIVDTVQRHYEKRFGPTCHADFDSTR